MNERQTVDAHAEQMASEIVADTAPPPPRIHHEIDISYAAVAKVLGAVVGLWLVAKLSTVLIILAMSLLLVATFNPLVRRLQRRFTRHGALALVIIGILTACALPLTLVVPVLIRQAANFVTELPTDLQNLQKLLAQHGIQTNLAQSVQNIMAAVTQGLPQVFGVLGNVLHLVIEAGTVIVLAIYLLIDGPEVAQASLRLLPRDRRLGVRRLFSDVGAQVGAYVRGQLILSLCAGMSFAMILFALEIPNALALAMAAALADCIPIFGVFIALVPACLTAISISSAKAGLVVLCYGLYHEVEVNLLAPRIFGQTLGMNVSIVLLSILVGVELLGVVGAVLALPVAAALPIFLRYLWALHDEMVAAPETVEQP